ncbi:MAG: nucleotidyltransferase domain-containing protein, partial [Elusimicrobiota bacterium]
MIDVSPSQLETILKILQTRVPDCEVRAFGSRATWTAKTYSDLDLAIVGNAALPNKILSSLKEDFQESDLSFRVDVLDWHAISKEFRQVIERKYEILQKAEKIVKSQNNPTNWKQLSLSEAVVINPSRLIKKGVLAKFVSMANIIEHNKTIHGYEEREYSGGAKFKNGDTLMARITPCLENGKTAF